MGRPRPDRGGSRRRQGRRHGRTGVQRRGVRWQGGSLQPGADGARRLFVGPPGQVHRHPRAVTFDSRQASPDPHRGVGRL